MKKISMLVGVISLVATACVTSNPQNNDGLTGSWSLQKVTCSDKTQEAKMNANIQNQALVVTYEFKDKQFSEKMTEKNDSMRRIISQVTAGSFETSEKDLLLVREKTELSEAGKKSSITWNKGDEKKTIKAAKAINGNSLVISTADACDVSSGSLHFVQL